MSSDGVLVGWVYMVGSDERVKIGHSKSHPAYRVGGFQFGSPVILQELGVVRGTQLVERTLHAYLSEHCWMHEGYWMSEWFDRAPLVNDFIREVASPWAALTADDIEDDLCVPCHRYAAKMSSIIDPILDWFEARGVEPGPLPRVRYAQGNAKTRSIAVRMRRDTIPARDAIDASGCPLDYESAMRPERLLRAALDLIAPEWRHAFLRLVRGEPIIPGLLPFLAACPHRLSAVEAVLAEASGRMRHFATRLEEVIDDIPSPGATP